MQRLHSEFYYHIRLIAICRFFLCIYSLSKVFSILLALALLDVLIFAHYEETPNDIDVKPFFVDETIRSKINKARSCFDVIQISRLKIRNMTIFNEIHSNNRFIKIRYSLTEIYLSPYVLSAFANT